MKGKEGSPSIPTDGIIQKFWQWLITEKATNEIGFDQDRANEIAGVLETSTRYVWQMTDSLVKKGLITKKHLKRGQGVLITFVHEERKNAGKSPAKKSDAEKKPKNKRPLIAGKTKMFMDWLAAQEFPGGVMHFNHALAKEVASLCGDTYSENIWARLRSLESKGLISVERLGKGKGVNIKHLTLKPQAQTLAPVEVSSGSGSTNKPEDMTLGQIVSNLEAEIAEYQRVIDGKRSQLERVRELAASIKKGEPNDQ